MFFLWTLIDLLSRTDNFVVQVYVNRVCRTTWLIWFRFVFQPFLVDGYKFDFRVYVAVTSCDPFRVFVFKDGLARFTTQHYEEPSNANCVRRKPKEKNLNPFCCFSERYLHAFDKLCHSKTVRWLHSRWRHGHETVRNPKLFSSSFQVEYCRANKRGMSSRKKTHFFYFN